MDQAAVVEPSPSTRAGRWRIADDAVATDVQGIVVSGYLRQPFSMTLFVGVETPAAAAAFLRAVLATGLVADAALRAGHVRDLAVQLAFSPAGLRGLGLPAAAMAGFSEPFLAGMTSPDKIAALGDDLADAVAPGGITWDGHTAHILVLLFATTADGLAGLAAQVRAVLATGVRESRDALATMLTKAKIPDPAGGDFETFREHFGFTDGLSQPVPKAAPMTTDDPDTTHGVAPGDILIGYPNAYGEPAPGPVVAAEGPGDPGLLPATATPALRDLGRNGSYLVVRQLAQDVPGFWASMDAASAALRATTGNEHQTALWLASRAIGRGCHGELLRPDGKPYLGGPPEPSNAGGFFDEDPHGVGCPVGAHIRRANPRDGNARNEASRADALQSVNNHRILRRGRSYGPRLSTFRDVPPAEAAIPRGLLFMCLNTDIARQFEFVQQNWLLNPMFGTLFEESDPILGPRAPFTIPADPVRLRPVLERYVRLVGGDYYFLPGLRALAYLASVA